MQPLDRAGLPRLKPLSLSNPPRSCEQSKTFELTKSFEETKGILLLMKRALFPRVVFVLAEFLWFILHVETDAVDVNDSNVSGSLVTAGGRVLRRSQPHLKQVFISQTRPLQCCIIVRYPRSICHCMSQLTCVFFFGVQYGGRAVTSWSVLITAIFSQLGTRQ